MNYFQKLQLALTIIGAVTSLQSGQATPVKIGNDWYTITKSSSAPKA